MKTATLLAVIAMVIQTLASLYYLLLNYEVFNFDSSLNKIIEPLFFLSSVGLLVFFISLYQRQPKN